MVKLLVKKLGRHVVRRVSRGSGVGLRSAVEHAHNQSFGRGDNGRGCNGEVEKRIGIPVHVAQQRARAARGGGRVRRGELLGLGLG